MNTTQLYLLLGCAVGVIAHAAQTSAVDGKPVPDMDERVLQEKYHIVPNKEGLLGALRHERGEVRTFAALRLAADGQKDAIPPILAALTVETIEGVKINLAIAAAQLGAEDGMNALKSMCEDPSWSPGLRMIAAQGVICFFGGEAAPSSQTALQGCLASAWSVLRSPGDNPPGDNQAAVMAMNLVARIRQVPPTQRQEIRDIGAMYLRDQAPELRMAASRFIREMAGDSWAVSQLRAALDVEREEAIKMVIARDLAAIRVQ
jgi:HEAT repeat protein